MNFLIRTGLSLSLCFFFFVSAGQLHGQVTYSLSGNFEELFEGPLDGESFVAEFVIDTSVPDANPDSELGEYPGAILSASIEFESGFVSEVDFSGGSVTVYRDLNGGGISLQDESGESTILVFDLGNPFDTDTLPVNPAIQFTPSPNSLVALVEPTLGPIVSFMQVGLAPTPPAFAVISGPVDSVVLGDANLDGGADFLDVSPFIGVLTSGTFQAEADCNRDGSCDFLDVVPFIELLSDH